MGLYFPVLPLLPSQGVLSRQQRSSRSTYMLIILLSHSCQHQVSNQPTPLQRRSTGSPLPSQLPPASLATNHKQAKPSALCGFFPLPTLPRNGQGTNSQFVLRECQSLLGRLSGKRIKQKYTSFVAPPLMSTSSGLE